MAASVRAVTETTVYLDNFQNIDLFFQGYYYFKCRLYCEIEEANLRVVSTPFCHYLTSNLELRVNNSEQRAIAQQKQRNVTGTTSFNCDRSKDVVNNRVNSSSFSRVNPTPAKIFKNNLSQYNENAQSIYQAMNAPQNHRKNMSSSTESTKRIIVSDSHDIEPSIASQSVEGPTLRPQHNIRKAEIIADKNCFHSRLFYIRQSDERVDLGEIVNFKSEFDANVDLGVVTGNSQDRLDQCYESIFGSKKFYLEIEMRFKEASHDEIDCQDKLKMQMSLDEMQSTFQTVSTVKLLMRNSAKSGLFHFQPVCFDPGYFSSLSICVSSIVKEFKLTEIYRELRLSSKQAKATVHTEAIDSSKPIVARYGSIAEDSSFANIVVSKKARPLTKDQILALQYIYLGTLHQVYKKTRQIYIKFLKQIKPSAYLDVQGIQSNFHSARTGEQEKIPENIEIDDLYSTLSTLDQQNSLQAALSSRSNPSQPITVPYACQKPALNYSNTLILDQSRSPQQLIMVPGLPEKQNSFHPTMGGTGSFMGLISQPCNPIKPNRTMSDKSLDDGNNTSPRGNEDESAKLVAPQIDDEEEDVDIESHSCSGSRLHLETDHHHIPDAVTFERDKRQKEAARMESIVIGPKSRASAETVKGQDSPHTQNLVPQKQPKLILNANQASTLQMLSKKQSFDSMNGMVGYGSPYGVHNPVKGNYRETASQIKKSKKNQRGSVSRTGSIENREKANLLSFSESKKKSCFGAFNLSEILCMNNKRNKNNFYDSNHHHPKGIQKGKIFPKEDNCDFSSNEEEDTDGEYGTGKNSRNGGGEQESFTLSERYHTVNVDREVASRALHRQPAAFQIAAKNNGKTERVGMQEMATSQKKQQLNDMGKMTGSSSHINLIGRSQSPSEFMDRYTKKNMQSRKQMMSHSKSDHGFSMATPRISDLTVPRVSIPATVAQTRTGKKRSPIPKLHHGQQPSISYNIHKLVEGKETPRIKDVRPIPFLSERSAKAYMTKPHMQQSSIAVSRLKIKQIGRSPTGRDIGLKTKTVSKAASPKTVGRKVPLTLGQKRMTASGQLNRILQGGSSGETKPSVRAAVPSFSGVTKELNEAIAKSMTETPLKKKKSLATGLLQRVSQPLQSPSPYLEPDECLGITGPANPRKDINLGFQQNAGTSFPSRQNKNMSELFDKQGSFIKEERKMVFPPKNFVEHNSSKNGKKGQNQRSSLFQIKDELRKKQEANALRKQLTAKKMEKVGVASKIKGSRNNRRITDGPIQASTTLNIEETNDENIEEDIQDNSDVTLDSMTKHISQNQNHLGHNNPFQHEKLVKPSSRAKNNGAMSHRNQGYQKQGSTSSGLTKNYKVLANQKPRDYFSTFNMPLKTSQQQPALSDTYQVQKPNADRSPSTQQRHQKPAIFTKNSVIDTGRGGGFRESPTVSTAMEQHMKQLDISAMSNNVSCKNSRLMATGLNCSTIQKKTRTIETKFLAGAATKRYHGNQSIKEAVNESFARQQLEKAQQQFSAAHKIWRPLTFDAKQVNALLELQMRSMSNSIFKVWHKISRIIYLDPICVERVLRKKYEKLVNKYYSQMVVEFKNEDDLEESEFDLNLKRHQRLNIRESTYRKPNAILDSWRVSEEAKEGNISPQKGPMQNQVAGSVLFQGGSPAEEGQINPGKKSSMERPINELGLGTRRRTNSIFQLEMLSAERKKLFASQNKQETENGVCEENSVYTPNSRKVSTNAIGKREVSVSQKNLIHNNGKIYRGRRDRSQNNLGGKPLSPRQIEKSLTLARDRRNECSQVRNQLQRDKSNPREQIETLTSSSDSDDRQSNRGIEERKSHNPHHKKRANQGAKQKTKSLKVGDRRRNQFKYQLPIQKVAETKQTSPQDFEPIIIEEVFYNGNATVDTSDQIHSITPQIIFDRVKMMQASSKAASFISQEMQSTAYGGNYPKLSHNNKIVIREQNQFESVIIDQHSGSARIDSEESCDFFSDNLSENGAGSLPENRAQQSAASKTIKRSYHLFVLVHGFQASSQDMRNMRNHLQVLLPNAMFLVSQANERDTDSPIEELGLKLAQEVQEFIISYLCGFHLINNQRVQVHLSKLTFIGHSLGGIIIRESLKHLKYYKKFFHGYISLASPHLGYMYNSTSLIDAGMWLIKNIKQSTSIKQLSMSDKADKRDCYLYKLSKDDGLKSFKYVILVSSYQDSYAPHDSARIQMTSKAASSLTDQKSKIYLEMVENILASMRCQKLYRLDVNFKIQDSSLASLIGRTAHILMIECKPFFFNLIYRYRDVFCE